MAAPMAHKELMHSDATLLDTKQHNKYRSAVGSMQYFVSNTQWHLAHTLSRLGSKNAAPTKGDMAQLDQTIAWLAHNADRKISGPRLKGTNWEVYSDSDHAGDRGTGTRSRCP